MEIKANKLDRKETVESFHKLTTKYGVLDHSKSGGGHDRFYLGKEGHRKPMFLACSRAGWMCIYCDLLILFVALFVTLFVALCVILTIIIILIWNIFNFIVILY